MKNRIRVVVIIRVPNTIQPRDRVLPNFQKKKKLGEFFDDSLHQTQLFDPLRELHFFPAVRDLPENHISDGQLNGADKLSDR